MVDTPLLMAFKMALALLAPLRMRFWFTVGSEAWHCALEQLGWPDTSVVVYSVRPLVTLWACTSVKIEQSTASVNASTTGYVG